MAVAAARRLWALLCLVVSAPLFPGAAGLYPMSVHEADLPRGQFALLKSWVVSLLRTHLVTLRISNSTKLYCAFCGHCSQVCPWTSRSTQLPCIGTSWAHAMLWYPSDRYWGSQSLHEEQSL